MKPEALAPSASMEGYQSPEESADGIEAPGAGEALLRRRLGVLDQAELCALLGVDSRTVSTWRTKGVGPAFIKVGNRVMYREADVTRWLDLRVEQTPESKFRS
jgi:predicted DNA-binding transcriptional regulator AlpA